VFCLISVKVSPGPPPSAALLLAHVNSANILFLKVLFEPWEVLNFTVLLSIDVILLLTTLDWTPPPVK